MKSIKILFKMFLLLLLLIIIGVPVILLAFGVQPEALVQPGKSLSHQDVARIKTLLKQHDPRKIPDGKIERVEVTERDLNLLLNYALPYSSRQQTLLDLGPDSAEIAYTLNLPDNPIGKYLNISTRLSQQSNRLVVDRLNIGELTMPGWLTNPALSLVDGYLKSNLQEYQGIMVAIHDFDLQENSVRVVYQWQSDLAKQIRDRGWEFLLPAADRQRLLAYYGELSKLSRRLANPASLSEMLQPLFRLARKRTVKNGDPQAENRALLLALGVYARGTSIAKLVGRGEGKLPRPARPIKLTLGGREDLAKHFAISAALTVGAGSGLADAIGVFKELDDSRGGTGFSFPDLLADRAGVELAKLATGSQAGKLQQQMGDSLQESDFMPQIDQLPEGLMELEFKHRYKDLDSRTYRMVQQEIEKRIAICRIYR